MNTKERVEQIQGKYNKASEVGANTIYLHLNEFLKIKAKLERLWRIENSIDDALKALSEYYQEGFVTNNDQCVNGAVDTLKAALEAAKVR
jgi:hypothetical protein